MKIGGIDPRTLPNEEILVLPRGDERIVFRARGVQNMDEFDKLCPMPVPPKKFTKDGWALDVEAPDYLNVMEEYNKRRTAYMMVASLAPSEIEWDTVRLEVPGTWSNWDKDLRAAGLSEIESARVLNLVLEANCLDENKLKKARELFLLGPQQVVVTSSSPNTEPETSPSGEPASV